VGFFARRTFHTHMSDVPDDDPEGFDREAEREKLREKYERDQEQREATQQMSELLLKGATMTNQHCEECGSPIFRMDGEAFCPSCGGSRAVGEDGADDVRSGDDDGTGAGDADGAAAGDADGTAAGDADGTAAGDADGVAAADAGPAPGPDERVEADLAPQASADADIRAAGRDAGEDPAPGDGDRSPDRTADRPAGAGAPSTGDRQPATPSGAERGPAGGRDSPDLHEASVEEAPSLSQATASLRRAIVSLSEQAAQSDDPGRATQHLQGAREAAEALAALDDVN
jgi:hypothetical protein